MSRVFTICLCDQFPTHCDCLVKADGVACVCMKESSEKYIHSDLDSLLYSLKYVFLLLLN